jgi:hypothetical protein
MRAWLAIGALLLASPAIAGPMHVASPQRNSLLPHWDVARYTPDAERDGLPAYARLDDHPRDTAPASGLSFGPIHAESEMINGHRRVHYSVEGLTLFGGTVGGSVGHRGAMLTLHWPSPTN